MKTYGELEVAGDAIRLCVRVPEAVGERIFTANMIMIIQLRRCWPVGSDVNRFRSRPCVAPLR